MKMDLWLITYEIREKVNLFIDKYGHWVFLVVFSVVWTPVWMHVAGVFDRFSAAELFRFDRGDLVVVVSTLSVIPILLIAGAIAYLAWWIKCKPQAGRG